MVLISGPPSSFRSQLICLPPSEMISGVAVYGTGHASLSAMKPQICTRTERRENQTGTALQLNRGGKSMNNVGQETLKIVAVVFSVTNFGTIIVTLMSHWCLLVP